MSSRFELRPSPRIALKARLGIRLSTILKMGEKEFTELLSSLEGDPLFQKLFRTQDPQWKIFTRERFSSTRLSPSFYDFDEKNLPSSAPYSGVEELLKSHGSLLNKIRKIGEKNFEEYFLYENGEKTVSEIAEDLAIPIQTVEEIRALTDQVAIHSHFFGSVVSTKQNTVSPELSLDYVRVAGYSRENDGGFRVEFFSPMMARGLFKIDYDSLRKLRRSGSLNRQERRKVQEIVRWLELVNARKGLIFRILNLLPNLQKDFFSTGDWNLLVAITQKSVADQLSTTPSAICRAIQNRSIITIQAEEVPLVDLFPSRKDVLKRKIDPLLKENLHFSDQQLRDLVQKEYGVSVSRRSINVYRREISGFKKVL